MSNSGITIIIDLIIDGDECMDIEWMKRIAMHDYIVYEGNIYFCALNFNALYSMSLLNKKLEFLGHIPNELIYSKHLYGAIVELNGRIYMAPMNAKEIAIYDIKKRIFEKVSLRESDISVVSKFFNVCIYRSYVYFIPSRCHYVVCLNVDNGEISYIDEWYKILKLSSGYSKMIIKNGCFIKNGKLYLATLIDNTIFKISLDDLTTEYIRLGNENDGFIDMCSDGEDVWLIKSKSKNIIKWRDDTDNYVCFNEFPKDFKWEGIPYINILNCTSYIFVAAYQANMSLIIDKNTYKIQSLKYTKSMGKCFKDSWSAKYYFAKILEEDKIIMVDIYDHSINVFNKNKIYKFYLIDESSIERLMEYEWLQKGVVKERNGFNLRNVLSFLGRHKGNFEIEKIF